MFGFGKPSELKLIPGLMFSGEEMDSYVKAVSSDNIFGILVLTNKRILFVAKGFSGSKTEDFPFEHIVSMNGATLFPGSFHLKVTVQTKGGFSEYTNVPKKEGEPFVKKAREFIYAKTTAPVAATASTDKYASLERLADLKSKGIISEEEFNAEKAKILNG